MERKARGHMGKRAKQTRLPGTERKDVNASIEKNAAEYVEARNERMELTECECEAQAALLLVMEKAGLTIYRCDESDMVVEVSELKKAKVRTVKPPSTDGEDA